MLYYTEESDAIDMTSKAAVADERAKGKKRDVISLFQSKSALKSKAGKLSAKQEESDIKSTGARNDYLLSLETANAHQDRFPTILPFRFFMRASEKFTQVLPLRAAVHCEGDGGRHLWEDVNLPRHSRQVQATQVFQNALQILSHQNGVAYMLGSSEFLQQHQAAGREDHQVWHLFHQYHQFKNWAWYIFCVSSQPSPTSPKSLLIQTIISKTHHCFICGVTAASQGIQLPLLSEELHLSWRSRSVSQNPIIWNELWQKTQLLIARECFKKKLFLKNELLICRGNRFTLGAVPKFKYSL